jgi:hypothetical protein
MSACANGLEPYAYLRGICTVPYLETDWESRPLAPLGRERIKRIDIRDQYPRGQIP